jgi:hypothetical protein
VAKKKSSPRNARLFCYPVALRIRSYRVVHCSRRTIEEEQEMQRVTGMGIHRLSRSDFLKRVQVSAGRMDRDDLLNTWEGGMSRLMLK